MTASYTFLTTTGTVVANTTDLLSDIETEYKAALGATINLASSTAQGTLVATETGARTSVMKNNAEVANMINPNLAYGTWLDAVCSLLGVNRGSDKSTVGDGIRITGDSSTVIQAGSRVQTVAGDIFTVASPITVPVGGTIDTGVINSMEYGDIPLPLGLLTIIDGTIGWGTAEVVSGTVVMAGSAALKDPQLKNKRNKQLALQGVGSSAAIQAAVLEVANVTSCQVVENNTGASGTIEGVTFAGASGMWVCVAGTADPADVAEALYAAHSAGCPWDYGAVGQGVRIDAPTGTVVTDPVTLKKYVAKYVTPILFDVYVRIVVHQQSSVSSPGPAVQSAIMSYVSGDEQGEDGLVVGADVSAFEMAGAVTRNLPGMYVRDCAVAVVPKGNAAPVYPSGFVLERVMAVYEQGELQINNIEVISV